jgi:hypothetical protein
VRGVLEKTGCNRQAEVVALLAGSGFGQNGPSHPLRLINLDEADASSSRHHAFIVRSNSRNRPDKGERLPPK